MTVDEGVDISPAGDRGVLKRITTEGSGNDLPNNGCFVRVHYTGTLLDGSQFDSSRNRNEPFEFQLGKGNVIKAWDIGVKTMKKGEVCVLTCAPEYAYGANGSPPSIPPNATLQFEIEMLDWQLEDLSPSKNKGILRHIITEGTGSISPKDGSFVTVAIEGRLQADSKVFDTRTVTFPLGEGSEQNICKGIEYALEKFKANETSRLIIQPKYGFKSEGNADFNVPPNSVIEYTVTLKGFESTKDSWSMSDQEKIEQSQIYKDRGTDYFKKNKFELAIKMYKRVVNLLDGSAMTEESLKEKSKELLVGAYLNLSLSYLKATPVHHVEAKENATKALNLEPNNVKGLFRRGQALLGLSEPTLAMADFEKVLEKEPTNKAAANQISVCKATLQKQKQREKQLYANMFDKFASKDAEVTDGKTEG